MAPTLPNNQNDFVEDDQNPSLEELAKVQPLDKRIGKVFFMDTRYGPSDPPKPPRQRFTRAYYAGKAEILRVLEDWKFNTIVCLLVTYYDVKEAAKRTWLWIRDYILGTIAMLTILAVTSSWVGISNLFKYYTLCLAKRMGIDAEEWDDDESAKKIQSTTKEEESPEDIPGSGLLEDGEQPSSV